MITRHSLLFGLAAILAAVIAADGAQIGPDETGRLVRRIYDATGVTGGVVVHVGCGQGKLTAALGDGDAYLVQGLNSDENQVQAASRHIASLGLSRKVSVKHCVHDFLPYADNLVNLVVSEDLGRISMEEVMRVLAPGGVAYIETDGDWVKTVKPWPLEIDEWTHWLHGPDNNPVARDTRVGPPRRVQWIAGPMWPKSHDAAPSMTGMVSAGGRIFYIADDGPAGIKHPEHKLERWTLFARDAFNGQLLWKKPILYWGARAWSPDDYPYGYGPWTVNPRMIHRRLVAVGDRVYVTLGFTGAVSVLDAADGEVLDTLEETGFASEILVDQGRLVVVVDRAAQKAGRYTRQPDKSVVAVNLDSGETIWEKSGLIGIEDRRRRGLDATLTRLYLTSGGDKMFVLEDTEIVALDAATGQERWRLPRPPKGSLRHPKDTHPVNDPYDLGAMLYSDDVLFFWQPHLPPHRGGFWQYRMELLAISASDGEILWKKICGGVGFSSFVSVYKARGLVWVQSAPEYVPEKPVGQTFDLLGLNPRSGEVVKRHSVAEVFQGAVHHHRCYQNKATEKYILYSRNGVDFVDLEDGDVDVNKWVRGMCQYGVMPANGFLYTPPHPCACFPSARSGGYHAFTADTASPARTVDSSERLLKGAAYSEPIAEPRVGNAEWPTYRHDSQRSGATGARVPAELDRLWNTPFEEPITAPTVAGGKVFVATRETHRVCAVNDRDGSIEWTFLAGNRVDSPPTISAGRVYFGTADGYVFCLRASDGAPIWRIDANPEVRHILSYGQIESSWPVHGAVLVRGGVVYFAAGRSSYLGGGLRFYAVAAETGEVIRSTCYLSAFDEQEAREKRARGTLNDILVADGEMLFLKNVGLNADTLERTVIGWSYIPISKVWPGSPLSAVGGFLDENLFDRVGWVLDYNLIAKMMVYNDDFVFGMKWRDRHTFWHGNLFHLDKSSYTLFGRRRSQKRTVDPSDNSCSLQTPWAVPVSARVTAMTLTGNVLFFAGEPSTGRPDEDASALLAENPGGLLGAIDPATGELLGEYRLQAAPVWDGMAAASGRLYISTKDGRLLSMGSEAIRERE